MLLDRKLSLFNYKLQHEPYKSRNLLMANNHELIIHNSKLILGFRFNRKLCLFYFIILLKSQISHSPKHKIGCCMTDTTATMSSIPTSSCKNILNKHALKKHAYYNQQHIISKEKVSRCRLCSSHKSLIAPSTKLLTKNIIIQGSTLGQCL